jgi:hypothetical protein
VTEADRLEVALVPPGVWRPLVETALGLARELVTAGGAGGPRGAAPPGWGGDPETAERLTLSVLRVLHGRHLGLTPELAARLVPLLVDPRPPGADAGPWAAVADRLVVELAQEHGHQAGLRRVGAPAYVVLRVVAPLVLRACRALGRCYLLADDPAAGTVTAREYTDYAAALASQLGALAAERPAAGRPGMPPRYDTAWYEPAAVLGDFARSELLSAAEPPTLPAVDPLRLAALLRLRPAAAAHEERPRRRHATALLRRRTTDHRVHEGGHRGIRPTHRPEDSHRMLLGEYVNPPVVRLERVLNTGFLAYEREPRRERPRDALIAALVPYRVAVGGGGDVARACWCECQVRIGLLLQQHRLHRSEFRWTEGDPFLRSRTCVFPLQRMPTVADADPEAPPEGYRAAFRSVLRWLPAYVDGHAPFSAPARPPPVPADRGDDPTTSWRRAVAWASSAWGPCDDFAFVHAMLFLPTAALPPDEPPRTAAGRVRGALGARLGLAQRPGRSVSVVWVPERAHDPAAWLVAGPRGDPAGLRRDGEDPPPGVVAGRLVARWFDLIVEEMRRA